MQGAVCIITLDLFAMGRQLMFLFCPTCATMFYCLTGMLFLLVSGAYFLQPLPAIGRGLCQAL